MGSILYYVCISIGILLCAFLSYYVLTETLSSNSEAGTTYSIKTTPPPTPEIVAAITATLSTIMGVPAYNFVIKSIKGGQNA